MQSSVHLLVLCSRKWWSIGSGLSFRSRGRGLKSSRAPMIFSVNSHRERTGYCIMRIISKKMCMQLLLFNGILIILFCSRYNARSWCEFQPESAYNSQRDRREMLLYLRSRHPSADSSWRFAIRAHARWWVDITQTCPIAHTWNRLVPSYNDNKRFHVTLAYLFIGI